MAKQILLLIFLLISATLHARELTITSFNIRYLGLGGEPAGTIEDEFRIPWIQTFMRENNLFSDVIIFQEIVDKQKVKEILPVDYTCESYKSSQENHQHVVICYYDDFYDGGPFAFMPVKGDHNYIIEESALTKYRPAVYGVLRDFESNNPLLRVVGVHLKAQAERFETRKEQATIIKDALKGLDQNIPTMIIGDFNLHSEDEVNSLSTIFNDIGLSHVENKESTYRSPSFEGILDHVWLSGNVKHSDLRVVGPKGKEEREAKRFDNLFFYNKFVSDHAAITLRIDL